VAGNSIEEGEKIRKTNQKNAPINRGRFLNFSVEKIALSGYIYFV